MKQMTTDGYLCKVSDDSKDKESNHGQISRKTHTYNWWY
jgi:hypothetical protein